MREERLAARPWGSSRRTSASRSTGRSGDRVASRAAGRERRRLDGAAQERRRRHARRRSGKGRHREGRPPARDRRLRSSSSSRRRDGALVEDGRAVPGRQRAGRGGRGTGVVGQPGDQRWNHAVERGVLLDRSIASISPADRRGRVLRVRARRPCRSWRRRAVRSEPWESVTPGVARDVLELDSRSPPPDGGGLHPPQSTHVAGGRIEVAEGFAGLMQLDVSALVPHAFALADRAAPRRDRARRRARPAPALVIATTPRSAPGRWTTSRTAVAGRSTRSTSRSTPRSTAGSTLITGRPDDVRCATTSTGTLPARNRAPVFHQRASSDGCSTKNAPSIPCGRPTFPMATLPAPAPRMSAPSLLGGSVEPTPLTPGGSRATRSPRHGRSRRGGSPR